VQREGFWNGLGAGERKVFINQFTSEVTPEIGVVLNGRGRGSERSTVWGLTLSHVQREEFWNGLDVGERKVFINQFTSEVAPEMGVVLNGRGRVSERCRVWWWMLSEVQREEFWNGLDVGDRKVFINRFTSEVTPQTGVTQGGGVRVSER
jgi:hypothetical protein